MTIADLLSSDTISILDGVRAKVQAKADASSTKAAKYAALVKQLDDLLAFPGDGQFDADIQADAAQAVQSIIADFAAASAGAGPRVESGAAVG